MSEDRKYRQRGYQDQPREPRGPSPKPEPTPREFRTPNMPGFSQVVRCRRCGNTVGTEIGFESRCSRCGADLRSCAQCQSFDPGARFECMQPMPARVSPKDVRNNCELYHPTVTVERDTGSPAPVSARKAFDDLFK